MEAFIFTDGSSLGNPGPGGFCAIIKMADKNQIVKGGNPHTTNNRMEMSAIIAALFWLHKNHPKIKCATITSDSNLLIQTLNLGWKRKKNLDLWEKLDFLCGQFEKLRWKWVKGHAGHKENTEADKKAVQEAKKRQKALRSRH